MTDTATPYTPAPPEGAGDRPVPPPRAFTSTAVVEALLDAQFAAYEYRVCACGAR